MIIAGEYSGDRLGGALMHALKQSSEEDLSFIGLGGPEMIKEGLVSAFDIEETNIMGLLEVLPSIPRLLKRKKELIALAKSEKISALVTIDAPDFCLRVAKGIKKEVGVPCVHYVSPQIWAWRKGRATKMAKYLDHVLALFPFEPELYNKTGLTCSFVGHPILQELKAYTPEETPRLLGGTPRLALLPGSRLSVMGRLFPHMMDVVLKLRAEGFLGTVIVPVTKPEHQTYLQTQVPKGADITFISAEKRFDYLKDTTAALAASGTSNLELAVLGVPVLVAYKMKPLTYKILRLLVKVPYISPINWVVGKSVVPEFIQEACSVENILPELSTLLEKESLAHQHQVQALKHVRSTLRGKSNPSKEAANIVLSYISNAN